MNKWTYLKLLAAFFTVLTLVGCDAQTTVISQGYSWDITIPGATWAQAYDGNDKVELNVTVEGDDANALPHTVYLRLNPEGEMTASSDDDGTAICKQSPDVYYQECNVSMGGKTYLMAVHLTSAPDSDAPKSDVSLPANNDPVVHNSESGDLACNVHPKPEAPANYRPVGTQEVYMIFTKDMATQLTTITITVDAQGNGVYTDSDFPANNITFGPGYFEKDMQNGATVKLYLDCDGTLHEPDYADNAHQVP